MQTRNYRNNLLVAFCVSVAAALLGVPSAYAQVFQPFGTPEVKDSTYLEVPEGYEWVDSIIYVPVAAMDTSYVGRDVFDIDVRQSVQLAGSMSEHMRANPSRVMNGYRVRIFFDNMAFNLASDYFLITLVKTKSLSITELCLVLGS